MPADMNSAWIVFQSVSLMSTEYVCNVGAKRSEQLIPPVPASAEPPTPPAPVVMPAAPPADVMLASTPAPPAPPVVPDGPELPHPTLLWTAKDHTRNATP